MAREKGEEEQYFAGIVRKYDGKRDISTNDVKVIKEQIEELSKLRGYKGILESKIKDYERFINFIDNGVMKSLVNMLGREPEKIAETSYSRGTSEMSIKDMVEKYKKCAPTIMKRLKEHKIKPIRLDGRKAIYDINADREYIFEGKNGTKEKPSKEIIEGMTIKEIAKEYDKSIATIYIRVKEKKIKQVGKKGKAVLYKVLPNAFVKKKKN